MKRTSEDAERILDNGTTAMRDNVATAEQIELAASRIFRNLQDERNKKKAIEKIELKALSTMPDRTCA